MDVINARPDLVRITELHEYVQKLHLGTRGLDGDDIRVHRGDRLDDVVELAVTHVGVYLRPVFDAGGRKPKGLHRPLEILRPVRLPERQSFADRRFVDLDDRRTALFKVRDFVAYRQG